MVGKIVCPPIADAAHPYLLTERQVGVINVEGPAQLAPIAANATLLITGLGTTDHVTPRIAAIAPLATAHHRDTAPRHASAHRLATAPHRACALRLVTTSHRACARHPGAVHHHVAAPHLADVPLQPAVLGIPRPIADAVLPSAAAPPPQGSQTSSVTSRSVPCHKVAALLP